MRVIRKIVNANRNNKIVFVNHQGKPITYYVKKNNDLILGGCTTKKTNLAATVR